jgi:hypothetical protein
MPPAFTGLRAYALPGCRRYRAEAFRIMNFSRSVRAAFARQVLEMLAHGQPVSPNDAIQLRNWAIRPEDAMLSLEEIAHRILNQEESEAEQPPPADSGGR